MGLQVKSVDLVDFRTYRRFRLADLSSLTVIVGPNAIGKTNLLEAIQLTTALQTFRTAAPASLLRSGADAGSVVTALEGDGRALEVELRLTAEGKVYLLNGKKKRASSLRGLLPAVLFSPDDLDLVKGGQAVKRASIDVLGAQLSANYHAVRRDYEKILRQKNRYLKDSVSPAFLESINEVLCTVGAQLCVLRAQLVKALEPHLCAAYAQLAPNGEKVQAAYVPSWLRHEGDLQAPPEPASFDRVEAHDALARALGAAAAEEYRRRRALYGPHLDRLEFYLERRNAREFASQGQQRSLVLAFKMAEVALLRDRLGQSPVLLLDDVMSELDESRRAGLYALMSGDVQTFVTATNAESLAPELMADARLVDLGAAL